MPACRRAVLDLLFPPRCELCQQPLDEGQPPLLCEECRQRLLVHAEPACRRCGLAVAEIQSPGPDCPACARRRLAFDGVTGLGPYQGELREAVLRMKEPTGEPLAAALGSLLAARLLDRLAEDPPQLVVPVPPYWLRRLASGAHGPGVLAAAIARRLGCPAAGGLLYCRRNIRKQAMLEPAARRRNVRGAYAVRKGYDIKGAHLLLVDDILTTGATAHETAGILRRAGARAVHVAIVARTRPPHAA